MRHALLIIALILIPIESLRATQPSQPSSSTQAFRAKLQAMVTQHLNQLIGESTDYQGRNHQQVRRHGHGRWYGERVFAQY